MEKDNQVSFMVFCHDEPYSSMTASEAWEEYLKRVKGKLQAELKEYLEV